MGTYTITILPGDGIGSEVTGQATRVLQAISEQYGHTFTFHKALVGLAAIEEEGDAISDATMELCRQSDAILFGAVGGIAGQEGKNQVKPEKALFQLRKDFELYANLRPVKPMKALLNATSASVNCACTS